MHQSNLKEYIRSIPGFPKEGIIFRDITTLLQDKGAFKKAVDLLAKGFKDKSIDKVVAVEARGFIFGGALAYKLGAGVVPVRKKGKLPYKTYEVTYSLEYGTDTLTIHQDAIKSGERVLVVDDLLATGGTVKAASELVQKLGGEIVAVVFLIELVDLKGREKLKNFPISAFVEFEGE